MTKKEVLAIAEPLVQQLAKCCKSASPCPEVRACGQIGRNPDYLGYYRYYTTPPVISLRIRGFTIDTVLHEFAHHLQSLKYGDARGEIPLEMEVHGKEFLEELWRVTSHYYGDAEKYCWGTEDDLIMNDGCYVTLIRRTTMPPLAYELLKQHPEVFSEYVRKREKEMVPCKACAAAAGAGR